ncbi:FMN-binding negative transcriptional regulator [Priestia koreensis]|uniref:FMN-binding negative transcriptional regulator n=1 Tax=Priestia koreensis TaxID=284581 RepID=UPI001F5A41BE|nr:FMN-binding negative transcriptional regulator [Priestia koreensis]MCM3004234.1 FMN-binding negative transcriptional regulator [Priestia koreensis]UNL83450.1 FMN-binding negative transcriptional regulator [Priestia koreensis]
MYIPKYFKMNEEKELFQFMNDYSFATVISMHEGVPTATQLPLVIDEDNRQLYGHFARANGQWKDAENQEVLVLFQGPHAYISPSWYESTQAVPTWNYVAVHVYGTLKMMEDANDVASALSDMVSVYESPTSTYRLEEAGEDYLHGLQKGIVGFHISIERIEGKEKLSQNHSVDRQKRIVAALEKQPYEDSHKIAERMKKKIQYNESKDRER